MIEIDSLCFAYAGRKEEALHEVSFSVEKGETVLLLGPSGSGKSTIALALNGLIPQVVEGDMSGSVHMFGLDTRETPVYELTRNVGIVFQDPESQFVTMKVDDEVAFGLENLCVPPEKMDGMIGEALEKVSMAGYRYGRIDKLSGGEKQRISLATILATCPSVLIFDEPTANLDPVGTCDVFETIRALRQSGDYTIILIEHKLDELIHLVDRVVVIGEGGRILVAGKPEEVFDKYAGLLIEHGVWMPQTALLAYRLREKGIRLPVTPLTIDQAARALEGLSPYGRPEENKEPLIGFPPAIEIKGLSFGYDDKREAIKDISLTVRRGDFLAIVGANGAGKTTLAKHFADILHPARGKVLIDGKDVTGLSSKEMIRHIGFVFQNPEHQFVTDSVEHELSFGLRLMGLPEPEIDRRVSRTLERFGLTKYRHASPFTLSHGEKRRLSVATMVIVGQDILILDEPTFGQDMRNAGELLQLLRSLNDEGRTIIIITHDIGVVAGYAKSVAAMAGGKVIFYGSPGELFTRGDVLSEARLMPPPLARLSMLLAAKNPSWAGLYTVDRYVAALEGPVKTREELVAYARPVL